MVSNFKSSKGGIWIVIAIVVAFFWLSVFRLSYNFPYYDDFTNMVEFIIRFRASNSALAKLALLFEQNFEHRVFFSKLLTVAQYYLTGQVNIRWLIIFGDLSLFGIAWLFYTYYRDKTLSITAFLGICCLLFQVQHYEDSIFWATCSLQHAPCVLFSLWAFHFGLWRQYTWGGAALSLLALLSSANGLATIVIWLAIVWFIFPQRKKALFPTLFVLMATAFHIATLKLHSGSLIGNALTDVFRKSYLLLSFVGLLVDPKFLPKVFSMIWGAMLLLPVPILLVKAVRKKQNEISHLQWLCAAGIIMLLFVAFLIVFARLPESSTANLQKDRYKIYAAFFGIMAIGFFDGYASRFPQGNRIRNAVVLAALVFNFATYYLYYSHIRSFQNGIEANQYNFQWSKRILYPSIFKDTSVAEYMSKAQQGPLRNSLPDPNSPFLATDWTNIADTIAVETIPEYGDIRLKNDNYAHSDENERLFVALLQENAPKYLIRMDFKYLGYPLVFATTFTRPTAPGFSCLIFKNKMKAGVYDVRLVSIKKGREARVYHLSKITI